MIMYLQVQTDVRDLRVDVIKFNLKSGEEVTVDWDSSSIARDDDGFVGRYKGVYFNDKYANGRLDDIDKPKVSSVRVSSANCETADLVITGIKFIDGETEKSFETDFPFEGVECDDWAER